MRSQSWGTEDEWAIMPGRLGRLQGLAVLDIMGVSMLGDFWVCVLECILNSCANEKTVLSTELGKRLGGI